jgi:nitroimidazol reductase NimA-like FMN-containing flavoprotein (pyridoxamine 5'-phosphate oxidase superfamily)
MMFLRENKLLSIATADASGMPHVVPVGYVYKGNTFFLVTDRNSKKVKNMEVNNRVAVAVYNEMGGDHRVFVGWGTAEIIEEKGYMEDIKERYLEKYPSFEEHHGDIFLARFVVIKIVLSDFRYW